MKTTYLKKPVTFVASVSLVVAMAGFSNLQANEMRPITLSAWSAFPENHDLVTPLWILEEHINELSDGAITFNYIGGPESIAVGASGEAMINGLVDIQLTTTAYYNSLVPESLAIDYSLLSYDENRASGALDMLSDIHEQKMNARILAQSTGRHYAFYMKDRIDRVEDFQGKRIRAAGVYAPVAEVLGMEYTNIPGGEIYSALERGVVEGLAWSNLGTTGFSLHEQYNYVVHPEFLTAAGIILINADTWHSLPDEAKRILTEAARRTEYDFVAKARELVEAEREVIRNQGVEFVTLEDADHYLDIIGNAVWDWFVEHAPEHGPALRDVMGD